MSAAEGWARDFYAGLFVDLWLGATTEEQTQQEADFLEKVLRPPAGASILDLACGGGRHCLELSARGYRLTGVDISPAFLAVARAAATERGLAVTWQERAMHDLPWEAAFDGAICMGNSLGAWMTPGSPPSSGQSPLRSSLRPGWSWTPGSWPSPSCPTSRNVTGGRRGTSSTWPTAATTLSRAG